MREAGEGGERLGGKRVDGLTARLIDRLKRQTLEQI